MSNKTQTGKPKLLITGAGGLLGQALCELAGRNWSVIGIYRRREPGLKGGSWIQADLTDLKRLAGLVRAIKPRAIIHTAAAAQVAECQAHPAETERINVAAAAFLADLSTELDIPLAFTSSDLVFDGFKAPYTEQSPPAPLSVYGEQKARAEIEILRRSPRSLVCRLPLMVGLASAAERHFTLHTLTAIAEGRPIHLFVDEYRTPVDIWSAAQGILSSLGRIRGLLHLGGRTRVSRYEMGVMLAGRMRIAPTMLQPVTIGQTRIIPNRAPDCSLDSRLAFGSGYRPADLSEALQRTIDRFKDIRRKQVL